MKAPLSFAGLLLGATALASAATAQTQEQKPTIKDRVDAAVETVTRNPNRVADTDMKHVLDASAALKPKPIENLSPEDARKQPSAADGVKALLRQEGKSDAPAPGVTTKDLTYPTNGTSQPARVYIPNEKGSEPLPVVVYYHGGGFVIADIDTYDATPRAIAQMADAIVVSLEYRKAPESRFPAAYDDAVAGYKWVLDNAASWGGDPKRVAVMGESAGGNLAINVAMAARDGGFQQPLREVLIYPVAGVDMDTPSYKDNASAKPLDKPMMSWFMGHYLRNDADKLDPRIDINGRADVKGLPPTTIITAQIDPLHDDGTTLADKLRKEGVDVDLRDYSGVTHEFFGMGAVVEKARQAESAVADDLKQSFAPK